VALTRAGSSTPGGAPPPDYREALVAAHRPLILDPLLAGSDPASADVSHLLYRRLLRLDERAQPAPDLASSWTISGDGLTYRFALGSGAKWSNGSPVTPQDVVASIAAIQTPGFADKRLAVPWQGVHAVADGAGAVVTTLSSPRAAFIVAAAQLPVVPLSVAQAPPHQLDQTSTAALPTDGGYRIVSSDAQAIVLARDPTVTPRPAIGTLQLRLEPDFQAAAQALAAGQVDALETSTPAERAALAKVPGIHLNDTTTFRFVDLLLNARRPGLADATVRKAISSAIDRNSLIATALGGAAQPQVDAEPAGIAWLGAQRAEDPQPALAARALDAAGWVQPPSGGVRHKGAVNLQLSLSVPDVAPLPEVANGVATQLAGLGIGVTVTPVPSASFDAGVLSSQAFDMAIADWDNGPDPDISGFWRSNATPPHGENVSGTPLDLFLDRALDDLATETDAQLRQAAALRVEQRLTDDVPAVFLYAPQVSLATRATLDHVAVPAVGTAAGRWTLVDQWRRGGG
jgi:peptide/nickel transport system substrate-binding protein